ncbi:MAG: hypothetical protein RLY43_2344 [Bacteroidota bacterium]|jgi:hypothetical protein
MSNNKKNVEFFEIYRDHDKFGYGTMLCCKYNNKLEYVMWKAVQGFRREVINQELLDLYNKGE